MLHRIQFEVCNAHHIGGGVGLPAFEQRADAGQQFRVLEGLHQVIIRAKVEAPHLVIRLPARGQHEDWRLFRTPQSGQYRIAIQAGQHHIEDHQIVIPVDSCMQPVDTVVSDVHGVSAFTQPLGQVVGGALLIFDKQKFHVDLTRDDRFVIFRPACIAGGWTRLATGCYDGERPTILKGLP